MLERRKATLRRDRRRDAAVARHGWAKAKRVFALDVPTIHVLKRFCVADYSTAGLSAHGSKCRLLIHEMKDVDGRDKPGHDVMGTPRGWRTLGLNAVDVLDHSAAGTSRNGLSQTAAAMT